MDDTIDSASADTGKWGKHIDQAMQQADQVRRRPKPNAQAAAPEIEGFVIDGVAGVGGMGLVYRATQQRLNRVVALKFLPGYYETANPDAVARFRREATAAARLHHTNIIPIYDFGRCPQGYYYVMELIEGRPLSDVIRSLASMNVQHTPTNEIAKAIDGRRLARMSTDGADTNPSQSTIASAAFERWARTDYAYDSATGITRAGRIYFHQVAEWIASVAEALDYAHAQGIVHRDIKPSNLILAEDGRLMVGDFGIARSADDATVTLSGALVGTPKYMSPEQAAGKTRMIDHHTDVYSLGATLYELLTFQPAVAGTEQGEILHNIVHIEPKSPRKINAQVPRELATICLKMMEKAPARRYRRAQHVADDLRRYVNHLPLRAKPPSVLQRAVKFARRHRSACLAVGVMAVLLIVAGFALRERAHRRIEEQQRLFEAQQRMIETAIAHVVADEWIESEAAFQNAYDIDPRNDRLLFTHAWAKLNQYNRNAASPDTPTDEDGADYVENGLGPVENDESLLKEADALCRQGLEIAPDNVSGSNIHGIILKKLGHQEEAIKAFRHAVTLDPRYFAAWANLAMMHALAGELDEAERLLHESTGIAGADDRYGVEPWRNLAALQLFRNKPETIASLQRATDHYRNDPTTWLIRARMLLQLPAYRDFETALDDAKHAVKLLPDVKDDPADYDAVPSRFLRILALAHLRSGQNEQAAERASVCVERGDDFPFSELIAASALANLGQTDESRNLESRIREHWPADLAQPDGYRVSADLGVLWFDSAGEAIDMRDELARTLGQ